jgi:hypothetical protein
VIKEPWKLEEDTQIFELYLRFGPKWSAIAELVPGRSDNAIKNRWNSSISKRIETDASGERILTASKARKYCRRKFTERHRALPLVTPTMEPYASSLEVLPGLWLPNASIETIPRFEESLFDHSLDVGDFGSEAGFESSFPQSNWELASPIGQTSVFF